MGIVHLPLGRLAGGDPRNAVRGGLLRTTSQPALVVVDGRRAPMAFCARCAAPVEFAPVWRGSLAFCSVECSLGGSGA